MNLFNFTRSFWDKLISATNRNISLTAVSILITITITSQAADENKTDRFSESPLKNGVASGWHLKTHRGKLTPSLSNVCASKPSSQSFELENALGYFISGDRGCSVNNSFMPIKGGNYYKFTFQAKKEGEASCVAELIWFAKASWSDRFISKVKLSIKSEKWGINEAVIKAPKEAKFAIIQFELKGKHGKIWIDDLSLQSLSKTLKDSEKIPSKQKGYIIKKLNGIPTMYINGKPVFANFLFNCVWKSEQASDSQMQDFTKAKIDYHLLQAGLDWNIPSKLSHPNNDLDRLIRSILAKNAKARFLVNIFLFVPKSWNEKHPQEILTLENGKKMPLGKKTSIAANSFASILWREKSGKRMRQLIEFLDAQEYSDKIMGFVLFFGHRGQWDPFYPPEGVPDPEKRFRNLIIDNSQANINAFKKWTKIKYNNKITLLNAAWGKDLSSFNDIVVPLEKQALATSNFTFRNPRKEQYIADYFKYYSDILAETLLHFAKLTKNASAIPRLTGAYFGGLIQHFDGGTKGVLRHAHLSFSKLLNSNNIDFFCNPHFYGCAEIGNFSPGKTITGSLRLHNKLFLFENDNPTHLRRLYKKSITFKKLTPKNINDTLAILKRDFGWCLCRNTGIWWWDQDRQYLGPSWFNSPEIMAAISKFKQIGDNSLKQDRSSVSQVAVLMDPNSFLYMKPEWERFTQTLMAKQIDALGKIGAPFDLYLLDDIDNVPPYKLYIFWNAFFLSEAQRKIIKSKLKAYGATALWIYAPGYLSPEGVSLEKMSNLIGIKMKKINGSGYPLIMLTNQSHSITSSLCGKTVGSTKDSIQPAFYCDDPDAKILGRSLLRGKPAFALKEFPEWNSIYIEATPISAALLRNIAKYAGVHIYNSNENDVIFANKSYLVIHGIQKGKRTIKMPTACDIYDAFENKLIGKNIRTFEFLIEKPSTKILRIE